MARFGILTGGGDCPGLNAVIRGVVRAGVNRHGHHIIGFRYGWAGILEANTVELTPQNTAGILHRGGTILGTSRTNPYRDGADGTALVREVLEREGIDGLIPIGGEDTLGVAGRLSADGVPVVGVPKTIDNDLAGTDVTFGFHTAVQIATDAIDRLHTTAESHNRVIVVEVMGRHAGWIAAYSGIAGGADVILVPERPFDVDEVCERIKRRHARGTTFSIVVVSEGATPRDGSGITTSGAKTDAFGHARLGGIAVELEREIEERTGFETRMTILGHVQRGGTPTAYDRVLATRFGVKAVEAADRGEFGTMVSLRGTDIVLAPLAAAVAEPKLLDDDLYDTAEVFFG
jgi:ATP-dependent phosphofructokinase / diphosphate-dependent phosphofructokinase